MSALPWLVPQWPVIPRVRAACTLRGAGAALAGSRPPYDTFNLALHVGDDPAAVATNRQRLRRELGLPAEPRWLEQVHGAQVVRLDAATPQAPLPRADAAVALQPGVVAVVQVADCMPVLFAARDGTAVGAAHAGWRGLAAGVLEATVAALPGPVEGVAAWLGPAIGPRHFEVGEEVRETFVRQSAQAAEAFEPNARGRWQCDLERLVRQRLAALGVASVSGGGWCTYADPSRFFSHRRDGRCGRFAALVWLE